MNMGERERIACDLLGVAALEPGGYAPCPGMSLHSKGNGKRDFRVMLEGSPTGFCFHGSCSGEVEAFNLELRRRVWMAERGAGRAVAPADWGKVAAEPVKPRMPKRPPFDESRLRAMLVNVPQAVDSLWLMKRSPVDVVPGMRGCGADFLERLYEPGEKVLVFTKFESQGQFGHHVGKQSWRLGSGPGIAPVASDLPTGGPEGVWFLCNPVTGEWRRNDGAVGRDGQSKMGRRHGACVTSWRYLVLENDVVPVDLWLRWLVQLPLPIAAVYTSGGRSVHALVRVAAGSKAEWDKMRDLMVALMAPTGADPASMSAVRLTRLPGCLRGDRLQELWYLNPVPQWGESILMRR